MSFPHTSLIRLDLPFGCIPRIAKWLFFPSNVVQIGQAHSLNTDITMKSVFLAKCLKYFYKFKKKHIIIVCIKLILLSLVAVLLADYRAEPEPDRLPLRTTRRGYLRKTLSTSARPAVKSSTGQADANKQNPSAGSATASVPKPFNYSSESLNQTHADMFKDWIDSKSTELYELSLNYSGFKLLNATYNVQLRKDAKFAWINFTEMIINISQTISQVLHHKTLIVKNLTDMVEQTFDEYRSDSGRVKQSASYAYYDAKSPKTFCDVQKAAANHSTEAEDLEEEVASSGAMEVATGPVNVTRKHRVKQKVNRSEGMGFRKRHNVKLDDELDLFDLLDDEIEFDYMPRQFGKVKRHLHNRSDECPLSGTVHGHVKKEKRSVNRENGVRRGKLRRPGLVRRPKNQTTTKAATTTTKSPANDYYYDFMEKSNDLDTYDYTAVEYALKGKIPFWNVSCINRTYDENFKAFKKGINRNQSTIHVPTNVYRQDLDINMTAYWTEQLDKHFKKNYDQDNEIFWQYFCSSNGLYRRFPGAYWNVPIYEDFFDCRLQSWYIMAAASSKDVLILLDVSGSMTGLKLEIAKKLIEAIMDTLSDNDFFNILLFSDESINSLGIF
ncbi:voltage-dependent calcium channel subunit alpha-2 delta-3 [Brachionus plicatilis]|uniref:Voltage-dependent calcium channel subunit alpha-2 delta-3 n=1 Tax=Brachionus plicatilis TaxID=10195 RepID=A0A3M7T756_BRAPC|nr:voltage-dependent calcium channel subunit alpha-2 delta-3 [Brachionus plicatilis]